MSNENRELGERTPFGRRRFLATRMKTNIMDLRVQIYVSVSLVESQTVLNNFVR